jgi:hypothetical protein
MVSPGIFITLVGSFFLMFLPLPILFIYLWRKNSYPLNSFFTGVSVFIVFYLVIRYYLVSSFADREVLSFLVAALAVEGGRYLGFLVLPQRESLSLKTGLSLALGYITAAFLLINAFEMAMNFVYAGALEGWGVLGDYLNHFSAESVDRVQSMILETPAYTYLLEVLSLYLAVPVQVFMTLLVFYSFSNRNKGFRGWLGLAAAVLTDFLYFYLGSSAALLGWGGHLVILLLCGGLSSYAIIRIWKEELHDTFRAA